MLTANSSPLKSGNNPIDAGPIYAGLIDADLLMSRPFWVLLGINRAWHQLGRYQLGWLQLGRHQLGRHQSGRHQSADINRGWFSLCINLHEYWGLVSAKKSNAKSNKMTFNMLLAQAWVLNWFFTLVILDYLSRFLVFKPVSKQSLSQKHVENHFVAFCVAFLGRGQASGFM